MRCCVEAGVSSYISALVKRRGVLDCIGRTGASNYRRRTCVRNQSLEWVMMWGICRRCQ